MEDLDLIEARWRLGMLPPEGLPEIARRALEAGEDGPALRALAELSSPTRSQVGSLFDDALETMERERMSMARAAKIVSRDIATRILSGELTPREGAKRIAWEVWDQCRDLKELDRFVTLMEKHEGQREHREVIDEAIVREAKRLLEA